MKEDRRLYTAIREIVKEELQEEIKILNALKRKIIKETEEEEKNYKLKENS